MIKRVFIIVTVSCIGLFSSIWAQVPAEAVRMTVQVLVEGGAKATPQLTQAVTRYYAQLGRQFGTNQSVVDNAFILTHAQKFVAANHDLFSSIVTKQLRQHLQKQLAEDVNNVLPKHQEASSLQTALEQASRQVTNGENLIISIPDDMLTGVEALKMSAPNWRAQLFVRFSREELDLLELALQNTDDYFFEIKDGKAVFKPGEEWNYEERFGRELHWLLQERDIMFTDLQWKYIWGGNGSINAPLSFPLKVLSNECYVAVHGKVPSQRATEPEKKSLAFWNNRFRSRKKESQAPFVRSVMEFLDRYTMPRKTPQENLALLKDFLETGNSLSSYRSSPSFHLYLVYKNYVANVEKTIYTGEALEAAREYVRLFKENSTLQEQKTPQENLAELQQCLAQEGKPSAKRDSDLKRHYYTYKYYRTKLKKGLYTGDAQKVVQQYVQLFEDNWDRHLQRTPQENLALLQEFLETGESVSAANDSKQAPWLHRSYKRYETGLKTGAYTGEAEKAARAFVELYEGNWNRTRKTPSQNLAELEQFLAQGGKLSGNTSSPAHRFYAIMQNYITGLEAGIYKRPQEETVKKYIQVFKANWKYAYNTPQENVDELNQFLSEGGTIVPSPAAPSRRLYNIYQRYKARLKKGIEKDPQAVAAMREFISILEANISRSIQRIPSENLVELEKYLAAGGKLSASYSAPGSRFYHIRNRYKINLGKGIYTGKETEAARRFVELFDKHWVKNK